MTNNLTYFICEAVYRFSDKRTSKKLTKRSYMIRIKYRYKICQHFLSTPHSPHRGDKHTCSHIFAKEYNFVYIIYCKQNNLWVLKIYLFRSTHKRIARGELRPHSTGWSREVLPAQKPTPTFNT